MKKIAIAIIVVGLPVLLLSCAEDIFMEEQESLKGEYTGWYIISDLETNVKQTQVITWLFTDITYNLKADVDNPRLTSFCICNTSGRYALEDKVELRQSSWQPPTGLCEACNDVDISPKGFFGLDRSTDTLKMSQLEDNVLKEIKLLRVSEPEE